MPGTVSNRLNAWQSKLFTKFPQKAWSKHLFRKPKQFLKVPLICVVDKFSALVQYRNCYVLAILAWSHCPSWSPGDEMPSSQRARIIPENSSTTNNFYNRFVIPYKHFLLSIHFDETFCGNFVIVHVDCLLNSWIGLIMVWDVILMGRQSGQKLQCLYENLIANNFFQNWILHYFWIATLKY